MNEQMCGRIRVGRSRYSGRNVIIPSYDNFTTIVVLTKNASQYGVLGPYDLKNEKGQIIENVWQFSKVYRNVPYVEIPYSTGNPNMVWKWPSQTHLDANDNFTAEFWDWRQKGKNNSAPVRNPVGWSHMKNCLFALEKDEPISDNNPKLDYIEARKRLYLPLYVNAVVKEKLFAELLSRLNNGENLLIVEIDGPHQESLGYYKQKYSVADDFIDQHSIEATESNLAILLNDPKHPFGHGYCLAWALSNNMSK